MHKQDRTRRRLLAGAENRDEETSSIPKYPTNATANPLHPPTHPDIYIQRYTEGKQAGCTMFRLQSFTSFPFILIYITFI